jgi:catechol 2,3-dioxygenase-like lactoylglutathione lyase family enzyme
LLARVKEIAEMLDHVSLGVTDLALSRRFYDAVLQPLGLVRIVNFGNNRGSDYGAAPGSLGVEFTITAERSVKPAQGMHLCFRAHDRAAVREFHRLAIGNGGRDDGAPGLRPQYHASYLPMATASRRSVMRRKGQEVQ